MFEVMGSYAIHNPSYFLSIYKYLMYSRNVCSTHFVLYVYHHICACLQVSIYTFECYYLVMCSAHGSIFMCASLTYRCKNISKNKSKKWA